MLTPKEFLQELTAESALTLKMLKLVPEDKYDFRPHDRSRTLNALAAHLAELPMYIIMAFTSDELDFAVQPYQPPVVNNNEELIALFNSYLEKAREVLETGDRTDLSAIWQLRSGDTILMSLSKAAMVRHALSHIVHHRAQLGVYFRMLDIPVPNSYGPTADDPNF